MGECTSGGGAFVIKEKFIVNRQTSKRESKLKIVNFQSSNGGQERLIERKDSLFN